MSYDVLQMNLDDSSLMLRNQVKSMFHLMKVRGMHKVYLVQENPQGLLSGSCMIGLYSHIAHSVPYQVCSEWGTMRNP